MMWRVVTTRSPSPSFLLDTPSYHPTGFGLAKQKLRRSIIGYLDDLANAIINSTVQSIMSKELETIMKRLDERLDTFRKELLDGLDKVATAAARRTRQEPKSVFKKKSHKGMRCSIRSAHYRC